MENFSRTEYYTLKYSLTKNSLLGEEGAQGITIKGPGSKGASQPHMQKIRSRQGPGARGPSEPGNPAHTWDLSELGWAYFSLATGMANLLPPISDSLAGSTGALTLPSSVPERYTTPSKHITLFSL